MLPGVVKLLRDEEYREEQAKAAYYRERMDEAALEQEQDEGDEEWVYFVLAWEDISDCAKRPYRTAVAQVCDSLERAVA